MGFLDRIFGGRKDPDEAPTRATGATRAPSQARVAGPTRITGGRPAPTGDASERTPDEQAIERYRYLLKTAPPETIEQAHAEAFAQLTPEQRQMVLQELTKVVPEHERAGVGNDDPKSLARLATRAEMRQPGTMERTFGGIGGGGIGMGGLMAGSFFSSFAGIMIGGAIAQSFFDNDSGSDGDSGDGGGDEAADAGQDATDADSSGDGGDASGGDDGSGDASGGGFESGDSGGGDFGGGDFGGGDFGGGDFGGGDF